jgi:threonine/homoserine/homoserine lactone efflux protein
MIVAFVVGIVLGFVGSIPVAGPTSVIVLKNTLEKGNREGLDIAVGAGVAEAIYAFIAFWGLAAAILRFPTMVYWARMVAGVLIALVGVWLVVRRSGAKQRRQARAADRPGHRWLRGFVSAIVNPTLLLTWAAVVTALHAVSIVSTQPRDALPFAAGVAVGIVGWFFLLVQLVARFRDRMRPESVTRVVRALGWAMIAIGTVITSRALFKLQIS